ncbi:ribonucleoprotein Sm D3 [Seminavis robusta]|uniref:Ribonucleoprotein Sm D3 n=1 Tax=Seminavis robusta TaxID=568900 RepID=A0A9N8HC55_9STRA|nr:ribonucleoprotein Sm D3 [Seminavis robusta]|eukprot:Sro305_g112890.1 ribonucleoprotein Sm D3 (175) ;mRNA; r:72206-72942
MSVVGNNRVGIPIVLLHDAEGAVIEVETRSHLVRGLIFEAEDQMNLYMKNCVVKECDTGAKRKVNQIYIRGPEIVFIILPSMLKHAPMFNRIKHWRKYGGAPPEGVSGQAVGQAAAILRKANERRRGGFGARGMGGSRGGGGGFGRGRGGGGGRLCGGGGGPSGGFGRGGGFGR